MDDKNNNPIVNAPGANGGSVPPSQNNFIPPEPTPPVNVTPAPQPAPPMPTPPAPHSGGRGSTMIVGGILLLFVIIVVALYFLILRQSYEPEVQITPPPLQQTEPTAEASPSASAEEQEVIDVDIEENLDEEFVPIDNDLNSL